MGLQLIETADGSSSLYNDELDEHYHSIHGSIREAAHVFIKMGWEQIKKPKVSIFEMGFGTGLNFMMTQIANEKAKKEVHYTAVETFPIQEEIWGSLNYLEVMNRNDLQSIYRKIHTVPWESYQPIDTSIFLRKIETDIDRYSSDQLFDLIYFDAFGPRVQPHLWEQPIFEKMYESLEPNGILVTYCAKGVVRRTLQAVGFDVERLPGPPGKREMLRAQKPVHG